MPSAKDPRVLAGSDAASSPVPGDTAEARAARDYLVDSIAARHEVSGPVLDAMRKVPRQLFVDAPLRAAYQDHPLRIAQGQAISQPHIVAIMTDALDLSGDQRVLEIGTGSGYQAAVLSLYLAGHVCSMEILAALADSARERLRALGYLNVEVRTGDGYAGWPEDAPFESHPPHGGSAGGPAHALRSASGKAGSSCAPVGEHSESQRLVRWRKQSSGLLSEDLGGVAFVPMVAR